MYGWRGRIGLILPSDNTVVEPELARRVPEGVSSHVVRLSTGDQRDRMPPEAVDRVAALADAEVDVVGYMCSASSFLLGPDGNADLVAQLSAAAGDIPAFTATTAMTDALHAVGATRVAVLAPHPPEIAAHLGTYLEAEGFEVPELTALNMGLAEINSQAPGTVYQRVRDLDTSNADGIFVAATNFRAADVIDALEADTGLPVVTANQAALWVGLRALGIAVAGGAGRLFNP